LESIWANIYTWGIVIVGLGLVIFIHELGHFLVAKACGVKCEKFYVGFDVPISIPLGKLGTIRFPRTLWKKQWGETEYGVGILPLGGYVKMLGQDDNPYRQEEEYERARAGVATGETGPSADTVTTAAAATVTDAPPGDSRWDPRSYLAKSVPQRMAIISAGVIMNVILAVFLASIAYGFGVLYMVPVVGHVMPGSAAWHHNLPVGLTITEIGGIKEPRYDKDVVRVARFAEKGQTVELKYLHPKTGAIVHDTLEPKMDSDNLSRLGITPAPTLQLYAERYALPESPAAAAGFQGEDRIIAVKLPGQEKPTEVSTFAELHEILVRHPEKSLEVIVERGGKKPEDAKRQVTLTLSPMPMKDLGLVMKLGKILAVQPQSPAAEAGIKPGDEIVRITGDGPEDVLSNDPLYMAELLRRRAGKTVTVLVMRDGEQQTFKDVKLREPTWSEEPIGSTDQKRNLTDEPMAAPALGIAYDVLNEVAAVSPGTPADKAGTLEPGQKIGKVKIIPPSSISKEDRDTWGYRESEIPLGASKRHWPAVFFQLLQERAAPGSKVELYDEGDKKLAELEMFTHSDWYRSDRGLNLKPILDTRVAGSIGEAFKLGLRETGEAMSLVVTFLQRIGDLWRHAAGPIGIVQFAAGSVDAGFTVFLLFLTMLSANLAVVNILPIPVLDGGHLVLLAYEGIRRKPPSEKVVIGLNFLGLALILSVMVLVLTLDIGRLASG
jgi:regulator of sigma E protease